MGSLFTFQMKFTKTFSRIPIASVVNIQLFGEMDCWKQSIGQTFQGYSCVEI